MAVALEQLVDPLIRAVNPPGVELFPDATIDDWMGRLADAFWDARLHGMLSGYTVVGEEIEPAQPTDDDMPRELQQLIVVLAAFRTVSTHLLNVKTAYAAKAGPVSLETAQSAMVLRSVFDDMKQRLALLKEELQAHAGTSTLYLDAVIARGDAMQYGDTTWVR